MVEYDCAFIYLFTFEDGVQERENIKPSNSTFQIPTSSREKRGVDPTQVSESRDQAEELHS